MTIFIANVCKQSRPFDNGFFGKKWKNDIELKYFENETKISCLVYREDIPVCQFAIYLCMYTG